MERQLTRSELNALSGLSTATSIPSVAMDILEEAQCTIAGDRQDDYGSPENCFGRIANYWGRYLGCTISPCDVALMMILLKVAREQNKHKHDNLVDICGYAALAEQLTQG